MKTEAINYYLLTYDVKDTSKKFNYSESTVRRWIKKNCQAGYCQARHKVLNKYDINKDGFISMDEYLKIAKENNANKSKSKNYQYLENIFHYVFLFLSKSAFGKYAAIPDFSIVVRDKTIRSSASIDCHNETIFFPKIMTQVIAQAKKNKSTRFIYFTLAIFPHEAALGHVNACIIDLKKSTLERFETYGYVRPQQQEKINCIFERFVLKQLELESFKYLSPLDLSPSKGIQTVADSKNGMCVSIVLLYFQMRIMNPERSQKILVKNLLDLGANELRELIIRYTSYIHQFLSEKGTEVDALRKQLYFQIPPTKPTLKISQFEKLYKKTPRT